MAEVKKKRKRIPSNKKVTIKKDLKDYGDDPYFKEKAEVAFALIKKYGLPETNKF